MRNEKRIANKTVLGTARPKRPGKRVNCRTVKYEWYGGKMLDNALYYPYISFRDATWIKSMALFYDRIYRIVPDNIVPDDANELQPLLEDENIGRMIDPVIYTRKTAEEFLTKKKKWRAAALSVSDLEKVEISRLHTDKTDTTVKELFKSLGYKESDKWLHLPTELASNYMLYLATEIGKRNQLNLITNEWAPWTATSYFNINGGVDEALMPYGEGKDFVNDPFALYCLILSETIPVNIREIPSAKIVKFRQKRMDQISEFRKSVTELYDELQKLEDPVVRADTIADKIKNLKNATAEYQNSADIINAKGWFGVTFMGFPAPVALGQFFNLPYASTVSLTVASIAIGGLFNIKNTSQELLKLQKENSASLLVEMRKSFKQYTSFRGGGDMNYKAFNCMEEYVND